MRKKCPVSLWTVILATLTAILAFAVSFSEAEEADRQTSLPRPEGRPKPIFVTLDRETGEQNPSQTSLTSHTGQKEDEAERNKGDAYLLTKIAMAEAEGEDTKGKALVMQVVLNRVQDPSFPGTVEGVIFQKGQFAPIWDGRYEQVEPDEECYRALQLVEKGWDESQGATYFESKSNSNWHSTRLTFLFQHGNHYFYK